MIITIIMKIRMIVIIMIVIIVILAQAHLLEAARRWLTWIQREFDEQGHSDKRGCNGVATCISTLK